MQLVSTAANWICLSWGSGLNEANREGNSTLNIADGGSLRLSLHGDELSVTSDLNGRSVETDFVDLRDAFLKFSRSVRDMLLGGVPNLVHHRCWAQWFSTELEANR